MRPVGGTAFRVPPARAAAVHRRFGKGTERWSVGENPVEVVSVGPFMLPPKITRDQGRARHVRPAVSRLTALGRTEETEPLLSLAARLRDEA